jgi:hypothetical protein
MFLFELKNRFVIDPNKLGIDIGKVTYIVSSLKGTIKRQ